MLVPQSHLENRNTETILMATWDLNKPRNTTQCLKKYCKFRNFREFSISELFASCCISERVLIQSIELLVYLYYQELKIRKDTNL